MTRCSITYIALYLSGLFVYSVFTVIEWKTAWTQIKTQHGARLVLLSPVWPIVIPYLLGRGMIRLLKDAF